MPGRKECTRDHMLHGDRENINYFDGLVLVGTNHQQIVPILYHAVPIYPYIHIRSILSCMSQNGDTVARFSLYSWHLNRELPAADTLAN